MPRRFNTLIEDNRILVGNVEVRLWEGKAKKSDTFNTITRVTLFRIYRHRGRECRARTFGKREAPRLKRAAELACQFLTGYRF